VTVRARERENCSLYVTMEHNNANTLNVICRTWSNIMFFWDFIPFLIIVFHCRQKRAISQPMKFWGSCLYGWLCQRFGAHLGSPTIQVHDIKQAAYLPWALSFISTVGTHSSHTTGKKRKSWQTQNAYYQCLGIINIELQLVSILFFFAFMSLIWVLYVIWEKNAILLQKTGKQTSIDIK
jgi:hypothetical protein